MLPVLILAGSQRQGDHWQRAVEIAALKLRVDPLAGALVCLPTPESTHVDPWLLKWRALATGESCHLQDLLKPLPHAAFPPLLWLDGGEEAPVGTRSRSHATDVPALAGTSTRFGRLIEGNLANRAARITQRELADISAP